MNIKEYRKAISDIDDEAEDKKRVVGREYAISNNSVKVGDVISDHYKTIIVETMGLYRSDVPMCSYNGPLLTKAGKPLKNGKKGTVYQRNLKNLVEG